MEEYNGKKMDQNKRSIAIQCKITVTLKLILHVNLIIEHR